MSSDMPFAQKESKVRTTTPSSCKMYGQIVFHSPLNRQNIPNREYQEGCVRQVHMKTFARTIDSRLNGVDRNRLKMLNQSNATQTFSIKTPQQVEPATRHGKTPYTYNTAWIDHPPENTSLHPNKSESYITSFLSNSNATADLERRSKSALSKYEVIRNNEAHFQEYVNQIDEKIASVHNKNMEDIRAQRKMHLQALEARNRIEKVD